MTCIIAVGATALAVAGLAATSAAQVAPPPFQVPAIREPHHFVKLENTMVRVLDVTVPAADGTLYHIHNTPYIWVSLTESALKAQTLGAEELVDLPVKVGEVRSSAAVTHRVGNIGATSFRNITVEIHGPDRSVPAAPPTGTAAQAMHSTAVMDNEYAWVRRIVLQPGESTGRYARAKSGITVPVTAGALRIEAAGLGPTSLNVLPGEFEWHSGPSAATMTNVGTAKFEAVEIIWK